MQFFDACPLCASIEFSPRRGFEKLFLSVCRKCRFVFDTRIPSTEELVEFYKRYNYSSIKPISSATVASFTRLLDQFEKLRKNGSILDIGCGQGDFLVAAKTAGWDTYGTEYSAAAANILRSRNIKVHEGPIQNAMFGDRQFDVITAFEVIEHINSPREFFATVYSKLRPGGMFYCTTPNFDALLRYFEKDRFQIICYPEHISFYTSRSLRFISECTGFKIKKLVTENIDIGRLKRVIKRGKKSGSSFDERILLKSENDIMREKVSSRTSLKIAKDIVNSMLVFTRKGDTLKAYLQKT